MASSMRRARPSSVLGLFIKDCGLELLHYDNLLAVRDLCAFMCSINCLYDI